MHLVIGACAVAQRVEAPACSAGIPYGRQFKFWLLLFQSSPLLWPGKGVEDGPNAWTLNPMGDQEKHIAPAFGSALCTGHCALATAAIGG